MSPNPGQGLLSLQPNKIRLLHANGCTSGGSTHRFNYQYEPQFPGPVTLANFTVNGFIRRRLRLHQELGKDDWYTLGDSWGTEDDRWSRSGWEVIAIRNADDTKRVGYYEYIRGATIYITVKAIDNIEVERVTDPDVPPRE
ncbi:hypothetical protein AB1N83_010529 [Pleurotus pulmonarius]